MLRATVAIALLLLLCAAPARADDLELNNGRIGYGDTGEASANSLTVSVDGDDFKFVDSALISAWDPCSSSAFFIARCPAATVADMQIALEAGDDELAAPEIGVPLYVFAGEGADTVVGGAGADGLFGNLGDDEIHGGPGADAFEDSTPARPGGGADEFYGDAGDDTFVGAGANGSGDGADVYDGGDGLDLVDYSAHAGSSLINLPAGYGHLSGAAADALASIERVVPAAGSTS